MELSEIHHRLYHLRKHLLKITQQKFAEKINLSRANYSNIETGKIQLTERVANDICREFSVRREWLLEGFGDAFIDEDDQLNNNIANVYGKLNDNNKRYALGYIQRLFDEQQASATSFSRGKDLSKEELDFLQRMLDKRKNGG